MDNKVLHNNLKKIRKYNKLSQKELSKQIGVSRQTLSMIEKGCVNPSLKIALKMSKIFMVDVNELFILTEK